MEAGSAVMSCSGAWRGQLSSVFFLPSSFSCGSAFSIICNNFPLPPLTASFSPFATICHIFFLAYLEVALPARWSSKVCTEESKASLAALLQGHAQSMREDTEVYSMPGSVIHGQGLGTCLLPGYFVLKDLF